MKTSFSLRSAGLKLITGIVVVGIVNVTGSYYLSKTVDKAEAESDKIGRANAAAQAVQFNVSQIQQFLTDVSATGERDGYDDAAKNFDAANKDLDVIESLEPSYKTTVEETRDSLNKFNEIGKTMASIYVAKGRDAGNVLMKQPATGFDARADELLEKMDKFIKPLAQEKEKIDAMVESKLNQMRTLIFVINLISIALFVCLFVSIGRQLKRYLGGEPADAYKVADKIAAGDFKGVEWSENTRTDNVIGAFHKAVDELVEIEQEMAKMEASHLAGDIDVFIDVEKFKGAYREMAVGINRIAQNHIDVLKKSINCLDGLAKGNFEAELERFPGKLALVNEGVEGLRFNIKSLVDDLHHMSEQHQNGEISVKMDANKFNGDYQKVAQGINEMVEEYIDENKIIVDSVLEFGNGNFSANIKEFPGEKAYINKAIKKIGGNLKGLIDSVNWVSDAHGKGDIDMNLRDDMFKGDFSVLAKSVNKMIAGLLDMNEKTMTVVKAFGEGNFDAPLEQFPGKKAEINVTIEQVRKNLKALNDDAQMLANAARAGKVSVRADAGRHCGWYE